jgi:hypothetical protein
MVNESYSNKVSIKEIEVLREADAVSAMVDELITRSGENDLSNLRVHSRDSSFPTYEYMNHWYQTLHEKLAGMDDQN